MERKMRIIRMVALASAAVFVLAGLGLLADVWLARRRHLAEEARQTAAEEQRIEQARAYLAQVVRRIVRLPVDPAVPGDIQSKYFEDYRKGRMYVWGMGVKSEFLFGVPADTFGRLNGTYDRYQAVIEKDGHYADRQGFLRQLVGHEDLDFAAVVAEGGEEADSETPEAPEVPEWRSFREDEAAWHLFSVPIRGENGAVLGNLYLKLEDRRHDAEPPPPNELREILSNTLGAFTSLSGLFLWFLLPTWVFVDARERGMRRAMLWSLLVLISLFVGLIVYLIARPEQARTLQCPGCDREVNGGGFCPHCGRDLSAAFCSACRYPLKPDWVFCPSCRAEIKPQPAPSTPAEAT
jgi:hypothetical protein